MSKAEVLVSFPWWSPCTLVFEYRRSSVLLLAYSMHSPASGGPGAGGGPGAKDRGGRSRPEKQDRRRSVRPAHAGGVIVGQKPRYDTVFVPRSRGWHSRRAGDRCMRGGYGDVWGSECRALLVKAQKTARLAIRLDGWPGTTYSSLLGNRRGGGTMDNRGDHGGPVAIIGVACRFPGAAEPAEFHDLTVAGRRMFRPVADGLQAALLDDWARPEPGIQDTGPVQNWPRRPPPWPWPTPGSATWPG